MKMTDTQELEKKVRELEARIKKLEEKITSTSFMHDKEVMDELYKQSRELVIKHQKASAIFLQRKLLIDFERATQLLNSLQEQGVIGPEEGFAPRKVLMKK